MLAKLRESCVDAIHPSADLLLLNGARNGIWGARSRSLVAAGQRTVEPIELQVERRGMTFTACQAHRRDDGPSFGRTAFHGELTAVSNVKGLTGRVMQDGEFIRVQANLRILAVDSHDLAEQRNLVVQRSPFAAIAGTTPP